MDRQTINEFWKTRSHLDNFLWQDLSKLNTALTSRFFQPGMKLLDLGCGDGRSTLAFPQATLVDFVRPKNFALSEGSSFVQTDLRDFSTNEQYDIITIYGVSNYFSSDELELLYHKCYGWLRPGGVLIVKHQCGHTEDVRIDAHSENAQGRYVATYYSISNTERMLRLSGFEPEIIDPYPAEYNKWRNTVFKAFICRKHAPHGYTHYFSSEFIQEIEKDWFVFHEQREQHPRANDVKLELLRTVKQALDSAHIPAYLMYGTLLGAVRDRDFISWDTDIDVAILDRFADRLATTVLDIPLRLLRVQDHLLSLVLGSEFIDIYTFTDGDKYSYCGGAKPYFDEEKSVFDDFTKISLHNLEFRCVRSPEESLVRWYGEDWKLPKTKRILSNSLLSPDTFE